MSLWKPACFFFASFPPNGVGAYVESGSSAARFSIVAKMPRDWRRRTAAWILITPFTFGGGGGAYVPTAGAVEGRTCESGRAKRSVLLANVGSSFFFLPPSAIRSAGVGKRLVGVSGFGLATGVRAGVPFDGVPFIAAATDPCPLKRSGVARAHGATLVGVAFTGVELVAFSGSAAAALPRPLRVVGMIESAFLLVCGRARG